MVALNLKANTPEEKTVLEHLIPQVGEVLADKINNGIRIEKDGETLINKKDLTTFMTYAAEQAKKQIAENQRKGTQAVCIHGDDIMSWAIHYFEEDSIEGKLYNEDGSEYKPPAPVKKTPTTPAVISTPPKPQLKPQISMFDLLSENKQPDKVNDSADDNEDETDELTVEEIEEQPEPVEVKLKPPEPKGSAMYQKYLKVQNEYPDSVIACRLGDFYEIFGKNAVIIAAQLNLTLTSRDCGLDERVPMIGFPYHAADNYFKAILLDSKVVVIEGDTVKDLAPDSRPAKQIDLNTGEVFNDEEVPTVSKITAGITDEPEELNDEEFAAFDSAAVAILLELLDGKMTLI